jgi:hypothetical protein
MEKNAAPAPALAGQFAGLSAPWTPTLSHTLPDGGATGDIIMDTSNAAVAVFADHAAAETGSAILARLVSI